MKKTATLFIITFAMLTNLFANYHTLYIKPCTKVYIDNLQWLSVKNEIMDYLKNEIINSDKERSNKAKEIFTKIKYSDCTLGISNEKIIFTFYDGEKTEFDIPYELYEQIINIIATSSLEIRKIDSETYLITRNFISDTQVPYTIDLKYSEVKNNSWIKSNTIRMKVAADKAKMIVKYIGIIKKAKNSNIEFVLHISCKKYSLWENNEGKNFNISFERSPLNRHPV